MNKQEFKTLRKKLQKTQKQLAELLGMSLKTVHSYEQGWREIPNHIQRQLYFLLTQQRNRIQKPVACWKIKNCSAKKQCPAWEFQSGHLCWFLGNTLRDQDRDIAYKDKMSVCRDCEVLQNLLK